MVIFFVVWIACAIGGIRGCVYLRERNANRQAMRDAELPVTIKQAAPIVAAIERYVQDHGKPPDTLNSLIPEYLSQLPDAGPVAEDGWHYSTDVDGDAGGWTLLIWVRDDYSPNIVGFGDRFVFRPSGNYPQSGYEGVLLPSSSSSEGWGYYVE